MSNDISRRAQAISVNTQIRDALGNEAGRVSVIEAFAALVRGLCEEHGWELPTSFPDDSRGEPALFHAEGLPVYARDLGGYNDCRIAVDVRLARAVVAARRAGVDVNARPAEDAKMTNYADTLLRHLDDPLRLRQVVDVVTDYVRIVVLENRWTLPGSFPLRPGIEPLFLVEGVLPVYRDDFAGDLDVRFVLIQRIRDHRVCALDPRIVRFLRVRGDLTVPAIRSAPTLPRITPPRLVGDAVTPAQRAEAEIYMKHCDSIARITAGCDDHAVVAYRVARYFDAVGVPESPSTVKQASTARCPSPSPPFDPVVEAVDSIVNRIRGTTAVGYVANSIAAVFRCYASQYVLPIAAAALDSPAVLECFVRNLNPEACVAELRVHVASEVHARLKEQTR